AYAQFGTLLLNGRHFFLLLKRFLISPRIFFRIFYSKYNSSRLPPTNSFDFEFQMILEHHSSKVSVIQLCLKLKCRLCAIPVSTERCASSRELLQAFGLVSSHQFTSWILFAIFSLPID
uniref:Uncharacterized protein n=1 Tax=Parascaris univalens TaxID=6257 RepID=A0A915BG87_PARUN